MARPRSDSTSKDSSKSSSSKSSSGKSSSSKGSSGGRSTIAYRAMRLPSGALLQIEARLGVRVLRTIPSDSPEGRALLAQKRVEIVDVESGKTTKPPGLRRPADKEQEH